MNLTRQLKLLKVAHNFFRFGRGLSLTVQRNRFSPAVHKEQKAVDSDPDLSDLSVLGPIGDDELFELRLATKDRVETAIRNKYGKRFHVEFFGSILYGVSHSKSDLDLVVIDPKLPQGFTRLNGLGAIYSMKMLARLLSKAGFTDVSPRAGAAVPIVQFRDPESGLDCDINVNDRLGLVNSTMIKEYCDAHPFVRPLLYRIKDWAKPLGLNSPSPVRGSPASFSSYALSLMTISFMQKEGHLPNLQANLPLIKIKPRKGHVWTRKPHQGWDARYKSASGWVPPPLPDFETLASSLFSYWMEFPYETESISIRHGGSTPRIPEEPRKKKISKNSKKKKKLKAAMLALEPNIPSMSVLDPFITTKNVTVSISKSVFTTFKTECRNVVDGREGGSGGVLESGVSNNEDEQMEEGDESQLEDSEILADEGGSQLEGSEILADADKGA